MSKKKHIPISFKKLQNVQYKSYYKSSSCKFYKTKQYNINSFYKNIANI